MILTISLSDECILISSIFRIIIIIITPPYHGLWVTDVSHDVTDEEEIVTRKYFIKCTRKKISTCPKESLTPYPPTV